MVFTPSLWTHRQDKHRTRERATFLLLQPITTDSGTSNNLIFPWFWRAECNSKVSAGLSPENHHLCVFQSFMVMLISIPLGIVLATLEALPLGVLLGPSSP